MTKFQKILLISTLLLAFVVRLYKIDNPIADWHSWRQADTSSVTRNYVKSGLDLLHPRFDDISNVASGLPNPQGWRMVEFPIYNLIHYAMYTYLPDLSPAVIAAVGDYWRNSLGYNPPPLPTTSLEFYGRLTSVISSLFTILFIFLIVRHLSGFTHAILSSATYAFLPYSIYYSRVILPDPMMVTFSLGAIYFFIKYLDIQSQPKVSLYRCYGFYLTAILFAALALLLKPTAIFLLLVIPLIALWHSGFKAFANKFLYIFPLIALLPLIWWRYFWIPQFPTGIAANSWLLNGDGIRLRPAWFRWLMYERLGLLILGGFGLIPFFLGLITKYRKSSDWIYFGWLMITLLYLIIFATGNVRHDYYQIPIIPIISIIFARGLLALWNHSDFNPFLSRTATLFIVVMTLFISWFNVRGYYQINNPAIIHAGRWANDRIPTEAKVIVPYSGDTAFLYQTNRPGWPVITSSIPEMIQQGATHYVSTTADTTTKDLMTKYQVLTFDPAQGIYIIELTKPK